MEATKTVMARVSKNHENTYGAHFAADAFFPFTDAPRILAEVRVNSGVVPAGGIHFLEVKKYFSEYPISVSFIPEQFRGFIS